MHSINKKIKQKVLLLLHNNARTHAGHTTHRTLKELRCEFWDCPSHSLDVALWNFHLFSPMKEHQYTGWTQDTVAAMTTADTVLYTCSKKLVKWWEKCINVLGDILAAVLLTSTLDAVCDLLINSPPYFYLKHYKIHVRSICHLWMSSGKEFRNCCT